MLAQALASKLCLQLETLAMDTLLCCLSGVLCLTSLQACTCFYDTRRSRAVDRLNKVRAFSQSLAVLNRSLSRSGQGKTSYLRCVFAQRLLERCIQQNLHTVMTRYRAKTLLECYQALRLVHSLQNLWRKKKCILMFDAVVTCATYVLIPPRV